MKKVCVLIMVAALATAASAGTWTLVNNADLATPLDTTGTLVKASNLGLNAAVQSIGGITYDIDYTNITGANPASNEWTDPALKFYTGADAALENLLDRGGKISEWGPKDMYITLTGLTVGYDYRMQLVIGGAYAGCDANLYVDGANYKYVYFGNGNIPKLATYTWTATSDAAVFRNNAGSGHADHFVLAYAAHEIVPEPATMVLLGLGGLIGIKRRK